MNFRFTIRGLFLLTTIISIFLTAGLWLANSPLFAVVFFYLLAYVTFFSFMYVFRYRRQFRESRAAWNEHKMAREALKDSLNR